MRILYEATGVSGWHEVLTWTDKPQDFNPDPAWFTVAIDVDPTFLDARPLTDLGTPMPVWGRGQMPPTAGESWLYNPAGNELRFALAGEVSQLESIRDARRKGFQRDRAQQLLETDPVQRKAFIAILRLLVGELNSQAQAFNDLQQAILNGSNLAAIKTAVQAISPLPLRDLSQVRTAVRNALSTED